MKNLLNIITLPFKWFKKLSRKGKYIAVGSLLMVGVVGAASNPSPTPAPKPKVTPQTQGTVQQEPQPAPEPAAQPLGSRTKTSGCVIANSLQDKSCTPGAVFVGATKDQVCKSGYSSSVRDVSESTKNAVYAEYGITTHTSGQYEVDHLVSLELGGSNDISNLWPEAANPTPGFHEKDGIENSLHDKVCSGSLPLATAQNQIASNWLAIYQDSTQTTSSPQQTTAAPQPAPATAPATSGVVKLSTTGICHAPGTTYYDRTTNYTPYNTLQECLDAGGRLPKN